MEARNDSITANPAKPHARKTPISICLFAGLSLITATGNVRAVTPVESGVEGRDATITEGYAGDLDQLAGLLGGQEQPGQQPGQQLREQAAELSSDPLSTQLNEHINAQLHRSQIAQGEPDTTSANESADIAHHASPQLHNNSRVWIVSVSSGVYSDADRDGFFSEFSINLDADTSYQDARVYARILLREGEQDYELFHTSQIFDLNSYSLGDAYRIEGKLVSNYPAAYYDVQVDLFDAYDGSLLDTVDASTHRTLYALPLESVDGVGIFGGPSDHPDSLADSLNPAPQDIDSGARNQIVREHVGSSFAILPVALLFLAIRLLQRRKSTPTAS